MDDSVEIMSATTFLAKCNDRGHQIDISIVENLRSIAGVEKALLTHVNFKGHEYCIAVSSKVKSPKGLSRVSSTIRRQPNIIAVTKLA